jgi:hypothetical protein
MKFRQYVSANDIPVSRVSLIEGDLLAAPSTGASATDRSKATLSKTQWSSPSQDAQGAGDSQPPEHGQPLGSGRPPDATDSQLKKAGTLATELLKILTTLPSPWNRRFSVFRRALRGLIDKVGDIS